MKKKRYERRTKREILLYAFLILFGIDRKLQEIAVFTCARRRDSVEKFTKVNKLCYETRNL